MKSVSRKRRRAESSSGAAAEQQRSSFEHGPRRTRPEWLDDSHRRLPLKLADGSVLQQATGSRGKPPGKPAAAADSKPAPAGNLAREGGDGESEENSGADESDSSEEESEGDDGDSSGSEEDAPTTGGGRGRAGDPRKAGGGTAPLPGGVISTWAELQRLPAGVAAARRAVLKERIATLAQNIIADPDHNVSAPKPGMEEKKRGGGGGKPARVLVSRRSNTLLTLHQLCGDPDPLIRKLAMISCGAVFRDVLPGYRITEHEDAGEEGGRRTTGAAAVKLKKEVARLRDFEAGLVKGYARFLRYLEHAVLEGEAAAAKARKQQQQQSSSGGGAGAAGAHAPLLQPGAGFNEDALGRAQDAGPPAPGGAPGAKAERISSKAFNAQKMAEKRAVVAARDAMEAYGADGETLCELSRVAVGVMCDLLTALPHFNFRSNLVTFLVARMASAWDEAVAARVTAAAEELFAGSGEAAAAASAEVIGALGAAVKAAASKPHSGGLLRIREPAVAALCKLRLGVLERVDSREKAPGSGKLTPQQLQRRIAAAKRKNTGPTGGGGGGANANPFDKADVAAGLRVADAEALDARRAHAGAALKGLIGIAFRVLRASPPRTAAHLLPPTLTCLSRFAHLIDVGVISDLLTNLKALIASSAGAYGGSGAEAGGDADGGEGREGAGGKGGSGARLSLPASLHAVLAALRIMSGPGEKLLNADETQFARSLYGSLWRAGGGAGSAFADDETVLLAAQAVSALLLARQEYSSVRAAAFGKRCLQLALALPAPQAALPLLSVVRSLCHRYGKVGDALLAATPGSGFLGSGAPPTASGSSAGMRPPAAGSSSTGAAPELFSSSLAAHPPLLGALIASASGERGFVLDPDTGAGGAGAGGGGAAGWGTGASSSSSTAWELVALQRHYHPAVASFALGTAKRAANTPQTGPEALAKAFSDAGGAFNPVVPVPKRHPLAARLEKMQQKRGAAAAGADGVENEKEEEGEEADWTAPPAPAAGGGAAVSKRQRRRERFSAPLEIRTASGTAEEPAPWLCDLLTAAGLGLGGGGW